MEAKLVSSPGLGVDAELTSRDPFQEILTEAAVRARRYLRTIGQRRVGVPQEALFAAQEEPELLAEDLRAFFRPLRAS